MLLFRDILVWMRIQITDLWVRIQILLFTQVADKMPIKNHFFFKAFLFIYISLQR
jgi:hypothetical protein